MSLIIDGVDVTKLMLDGAEVMALLKDGQLIYTPLRPEPPVHSVQITDDGSNQWFELVFDAMGITGGNAADGWSVFDGWTLRAERSEDLATWDHQWSDVGSPVDLGGGVFQYTIRSPYPVASVTRTAELTVTIDDPNGTISVSKG